MVEHNALCNVTGTYVKKNVYMPQTVMAKSGCEGIDDGSSTLTVKVQGIGTITFNAGVSSEYDCDYLYIYADDEEIWCGSGMAETKITHNFDTEGEHTITINYLKDSSVDDYDDCAYAYNFTWTGEPTPIVNTNFGELSTDNSVTDFTTDDEYGWYIIKVEATTKQQLFNAINDYVKVDGVLYPILRKYVVKPEREIYNKENMWSWNKVYTFYTRMSPSIPKEGIAEATYPNCITNLRTKYRNMRKAYIPERVDSFYQNSIYSDVLETLHIDNPPDDTRMGFAEQTIYWDSLNSNKNLGYITVETGICNNTHNLQVCYYNGVNIINNFFCNSGVREIITPSPIQEIGERGFQNCNNLTSLDLSGVKIINSFGLAGTKFTELELPEIEQLGFCVFKNCSNLQSITLGSNLKTLQYGAFQQCQKLQNVDLGGVTTIGEVAFIGLYSNLKNIQSQYVTGIGASAFKDCMALETAYFPSAKNISTYAFHRCNKMHTATITNVENIFGYAFADCTSLTNVYIGTNISIIWDYAFQNCTNLNSLTIPLTDSRELTIRDYAFSGCSNLTLYLPQELNVNSNLTTYPNAFSGLKEVIYY